MQKNKLIAALAILFLVCSSSLSAQGVWKNYTNSNEINDIAIEGDYIWCATTGGVVRWDRRDGSYVKYTSADGLSHNNVTCVAIGPDNMKWFGTEHGVTRFDGDAWTHLLSESGYNEVISAAVDEENVKWFGFSHGDGIVKYDDTNWISIESDEIPGYPSYFNHIAVDSENVKWFSTKNKGMITYDGSTWRRYTDVVLPSDITEAVAFEADNLKWIGTASGIARYDGNTWEHYTTDDGLISMHVISIAVDEDNTKWFGTWRGGLSGFDGTTWTSFTEEDGLAGNSVNAIAVDDRNVKWFGTNNGLSSFDGTTWVTLRTEDGMSSNDIRSIAVDHDNVKWFGTFDSGAFSFDGCEWDAYRSGGTCFLPNAAIETIIIDHDNTIWFANRSFDGSTWTIHDFVNVFINAMAVDTDEVIWFGHAYEGVWSFDGSTAERYTTEDGLIHPVVHSVAVDADNVKWFATEEGISSFDGVTWTSYREVGGRVSAVAVDEDNAKWFATAPGIVRYDGGTWTEYDQFDGLVYHTVKSIAVDADNVKWFITKKGVSRFDDTTWDTYSAEDGLGSSDLQAIAIDNENVIWFGTPHGIASFDEDAVPLTVASSLDIPRDISITGNYPNPFNPATTIEFSLSIDAYATLDVFNLSGQRVITLHDDMLGAGAHSVVWNGTDGAGVAVSSGVYFCRLQADEKMVVHRMVLVR